MTLAHADFGGWSVADDIASRSDGWGIFDCDGSENGRFQLCRDDELERFASDEDAWSFVVEQARKGSELHSKALAFLKAHNVHEHRAIMKHVGEG